MMGSSALMTFDDPDGRNVRLPGVRPSALSWLRGEGSNPYSLNQNQLSYH